jgi:antitoxin VapB
MTQATIFTNNRTQAVRLPVGTRFPDSVKKVTVRVVGQDRVISPVGSSWDSFFDAGPPASANLLPERGNQEQPPREPLDF